MKVGDKIDVTVAGEVIAQAEVKELGDGTVTFIVPASRVVMATKTEVAPGVGPEGDTSGTQTIIDEVVRATTTPVQSASGTEPADNANADNAAPVDDASKVITSSSVPTQNDGDPQNAGVEAKAALDPSVQAQINEIVAAHLAARAAVSENDQA